MMTYKEGLSKIITAYQGSGFYTKDRRILLFLMDWYYCVYLPQNSEEPITKENIIETIEKSLSTDSVIASALKRLWDSSLKHFDWLFFGGNTKEDSIISLYDTLHSIDKDWYDIYFEQVFEDILRYSKQDGFDYISIPRELSELIFSLADLKENAAIYNPFANGAALLSKVSPKGCIYIGQEKDEDLFEYGYGTLRLIAHGLNPRGYIQEDSFKEWRSQADEEDDEGRYYFDLILSFPPLGLRMEAKDGDCSLDLYWPYNWDKTASRITMEDYVVAMGQAGLKQGGKSIFLLPQSFFFRGGATADLRKWLLEQGRIDMIVQLPENLLYETSVSLCLIVLNDGSDSSKQLVRFVDGRSFKKEGGRVNTLLVEELLASLKKNDDKFVKDIPLAEIARYAHNLLPSRYMGKEGIEIPDGFTLVKLREIASIYKSENFVENEARIVRGRNLKSNDYYDYADFEELDIEPIMKRAPRLDKDSILIKQMGVFKSTLFKFNPELNVVTDRHILTLLPNEDIDSLYLLSELRKKYVQEQIGNFNEGVAISYISDEDILSLEILLPKERSIQNSIFLSERMLGRELLQQRAEVKALSDELRDNFNQVLSINRHRIAPYLSGLKSNVKLLLKELESGTLSSTKEIVLGYTVLDALENMRDNLNEVSLLFKNFRLDDNIGPSESIDIYSFVEDYSYLWKKSDVVDKEIKKDFRAGKNDFPQIKFNGENLKEILDEIIYNAEKHFILENGNIVKLELSINSSGSVSLKVFNNGAPMPEDFNEDRSFVAGYHIDDAGTGLGLFRVRSVCDYFGAKVHWENDFFSSMPVCLCITFK